MCIMKDKNKQTTSLNELSCKTPKEQHLESEIFNQLIRQVK